MEFRIQKAEFVRGLRFAQSIADRKNTMPILGNVLLRVQGPDKAFMVATDLNVSLVADLKISHGVEGSFTVGAKTLFDIVAAVPGEDLVFKKMENTRAEIRFRKSTYRVVGESDVSFPKVPDWTDVPYTEVEVKTLRAMIDRTLFSVCTDETRFHLNGVLFECDGKVAQMVSTDGHRLSKVARNLAGPLLSSGVIIPKKGLVEAKKLFDSGSSILLGLKPPYVFFRAENLVLGSKLIDAQFPPYAQVIPAAFVTEFDVDRTFLSEALRRIQLISTEEKGVKFIVEGNKLVIASDSKDVGEAREELDIVSTGSVETGLNPKFLLESLSQMVSERVRFKFGGELAPVVITPEDADPFLCVVMPMRV